MKLVEFEYIGPDDMFDYVLRQADILPKNELLKKGQKIEVDEDFEHPILGNIVERIRKNPDYWKEKKKVGRPPRQNRTEEGRDE